MYRSRWMLSGLLNVKRDEVHSYWAYCGCSGQNHCSSERDAISRSPGPTQRRGARPKNRVRGGGFPIQIVTGACRCFSCTSVTACTAQTLRHLARTGKVRQEPPQHINCEHCGMVRGARQAAEPGCNLVGSKCDQLFERFGQHRFG